MISRIQNLIENQVIINNKNKSLKNLIDNKHIFIKNAAIYETDFIDKTIKIIIK